MPLLSYEESLQQQVHFLKQGRLEDNESSEKFWISLLQNKHLAIDKNLTTQCLVDLINLLKNNDDKNISKILLAIIPFFNEVSTPNKKLIAKAAIQFSNPQKFPESSSLAKIFEFDIRIHNGDNIDFQQFFKNTKGGFFNSIKASVALEFYLAKNDLVTLKMLIEEMSEDDLFNWHTCRTVIYSLTELQKNDELELIKAALEEQFLAKLYEVWYYKDYPSFIRLLQNAKALKLKNHPTLAYAFKDFCTQVKEPENLLYVKALYAELNEDWQGLEELFDSSSQIDLNQKRFLFLKGTAAAHLNKPAIARENLQKFIALEKFDYEVILAQRLLETLR